MLHGGRPESHHVVDGRSASWRLMLRLQQHLARPAHQEGVSVWGLRYRVRGWNGGTDPVADARWALSRVIRALGDVPVVLLGHSMGARVAVHVAADQQVVGVVALAPWWQAETPVSGLAGRRLVAAHGHRDRITSYHRTRDYVDRASLVAESARFLDMGPLGHYLIRGRARWREVAVRESLAMLRG
jgi:pimeloyl-ACP methyl ester carboxylesterase